VFENPCTIVSGVQFILKVGVEESIVNATRIQITDQLFKSNLFFPFSFLFLPVDLPICALSVATFPFVLLLRFPFSLSMYLFIHLLFVPFLAGSSSLLLSFFYKFFFSFSSLSSHINYSPCICIFLYPIFTLCPISIYLFFSHLS
jgi:hypothetical protein